MRTFQDQHLICLYLTYRIMAKPGDHWNDTCSYPLSAVHELCRMGSSPSSEWIDVSCVSTFLCCKVGRRLRQSTNWVYRILTAAKSYSPTRNTLSARLTGAISSPYYCSPVFRVSRPPTANRPITYNPSLVVSQADRPSERPALNLTTGVHVSAVAT